MNNAIVAAVQKSGLTHQQVAKLAHASRSRITAMLSRNTKDVSTDLMLRVMAGSGYRTSLTFSPVA